MMKTLYLVRHGQASFGRRNYDRLSQTGKRQCRLLGEHWVSAGVHFDAVCSGTLTRQRQSLAVIREAYAEAGYTLPDIIEDADLNEFDMTAFRKGAHNELKRNHPHIAKLIDTLEPLRTTNLAEYTKAYELMYASVMALWRAGKLAVDGIDSWEEFNARVHRAHDTVMERRAAGQKVLVVSSGGPIRCMVRRATDATGYAPGAGGGRIYNSSVSEFHYTDNEVLMAGYNETPHLEDDDMLTYW